MNSSIKVKNFDDVLKEEAKTEITKEYIVKNIFDLTIIKNDIHYIKTIKVQPYSKTNEIHKLTQNNFINICIGGQNFYERENIDIRYCIDDSDFIEYDIDFPSPIFFKYHSQILSLTNLNQLYKIIIDGYCFDNITELVKEGILYEYNHNDKYHFNDETDSIICRSMSGMAGISSDKYKKWYKKDFNLYGKINDESISSIINNSRDNIEEKIAVSNNNNNKNILYFFNQIFHNNEILTILYSTKCMTLLTEGNYDKIVKDYYDYLIGGYITKKIEIKYIETKDNLYSITYLIPRNGDLIHKIKIKNKLNKFDNVDDNITIKLKSYQKDTCVDNFNDVIEFDTLVNFDPYNEVLLTITFDKYYMEYIYDLFLDIGYCVCNINLRKDVIVSGTQLKIEQ